MINLIPDSFASARLEPYARNLDQKSLDVSTGTISNSTRSFQRLTDRSSILDRAPPSLEQRVPAKSIQLAW
ncbi:MAG: hypothetical protein JO033_01360 [Acidobacteriaceae bacterium]|nr:hypothetical protein [Acidobacteriaceae bacterium]